MASFTEQEESLLCGDQVYIEALVGLVALSVAFTGYRIYNFSIGVCGALTACALVGAAGFAWYGDSGDIMNITELLAGNITSNNVTGSFAPTTDFTELAEGANPIKIGIIAFFCFLWSGMGALICVKAHEEIHKMIGFVSGAILGFAGVSLVVGIVSSEMRKLNEEAVDDYAGWQLYTVFAAGVPIACIVGYAARNLLIYVVMFLTAFIGSFVGIGLQIHVLECLGVIHLDRIFALAAAVFFTVAAFTVQLKMTPEARTQPEAETECGV